MRRVKNLSYGNGEINVTIIFSDDCISVKSSYDYMDYGTGNRISRIYGSKEGYVSVAGSQTIGELRQKVLQEINRISPYGIPEKDLPLRDFECYIF